jgi:uncharacterized PurR-regulated membrane protein YhhQ (DUF165 family)
VAVALIVVIALALAPQLLFTVLYWKWIPTWIKNPYGRLAQLGSWCHIILLSLYLCFITFGRHFGRTIAEAMLVSAFVPLVIFGFLQLLLLKKAFDSSSIEHQREEEASK